VQTNISKSSKDVVRGMHFQVPPHAQGKLVTVLDGAVLDVAVDLRKGSGTYGKHVAVELSGKNKRLFWVPPGFAHGFRTLEDNTLFYYNCTAPYHHPSERGILWNDPDLNIEFGITDPILSEKDKVAQRFGNVGLHKIGRKPHLTESFLVKRLVEVSTVVSENFRFKDQQSFNLSFDHIHISRTFL